MRVNVNANGQKQVALLEKPAVPFDLLYGATIWHEAVTEAAPLHMLVRMENKEKQGLGLPLPSGGMALFDTVSGADRKRVVEGKGVSVRVDSGCGHILRNTDCK